MQKKFLLSALRERHGLSRKEFSQNIGLSLRTVEDIEKRGTASKENLRKFVDYFNLNSVDDLYEVIESGILTYHYSNGCARKDSTKLSVGLLEYRI